MLELYVCGSERALAMYSPESIAAVLYIRLATEKIKESNDPQLHKFKIIPSKEASYYECTSYTFPFLKDTENDNKIIEGYVNIINYLKKLNIGFDFDNWMSDSDQLINTGLVNFLTSKLQLLVNYTYFINKLNYDAYTVKLFKYHLPFPLQYYLSYSWKTLNIQKCEVIGLSLSSDNSSYHKIPTIQNPELEENQKIADEKLRQAEKDLNLPGLSNVQNLELKSRLKTLQYLKTTSGNYRALNLLEQYIKRIDIHGNLLDTNEGDDEKPKNTFIFEKRITSSDILLFSVIFSLGNSSLTDPFMNTLLLVKYPKIVKKVKQYQNFLLMNDDF